MLAIFSFTVLSGVLINTSNKAYASTIKSNAGLKTSTRMIAVKNMQSNSGGGGNLLVDFLRKLGFKIEKDRLCRLTDRQFAELTSSRNSSVENVDMDGNNYSVLKIDQKEVNDGQLRKLLRVSESEPIHCYNIKLKGFFWLLFNFHVS